MSSSGAILAICFVIGLLLVVILYESYAIAHLKPDNFVKRGVQEGKEHILTPTSPATNEMLVVLMVVQHPSSKPA